MGIGAFSRLYCLRRTEILTVIGDMPVSRWRAIVQFPHLAFASGHAFTLAVTRRNG